MRIFRRYSKWRRHRVGRAVRRALRERYVTLTEIARECRVSLSLVHHVVYGDKGRIEFDEARPGHGEAARRVRRFIEWALKRPAEDLWPRLLPARAGRPKGARR